jgi:hypothetical protein
MSLTALFNESFFSPEMRSQEVHGGAVRFRIGPEQSFSDQPFARGACDSYDGCRDRAKAQAAFGYRFNLHHKHSHINIGNRLDVTRAISVMQLSNSGSSSNPKTAFFGNINLIVM